MDDSNPYANLIVNGLNPLSGGGNAFRPVSGQAFEGAGIPYYGEQPENGKQLKVPDFSIAQSPLPKMVSLWNLLFLFWRGGSG